MDFVKKHYGGIVLAVLSGIPVLLWLLNVGLSSVTSSFAAVVAASGKAVALVGTSLYLMMPILSMRHSVIEKAFGGLGNLYTLHKRAGKISFYLIALHPVLLGLGRMLGGKSFSSIWDWWSWLIVLGVVAFLVLSFITIFAIYAHIRHQNWVMIHRLFGWLIPLFLIHGLLAQNQLVKAPGLLPYIGILAAVGFIGFLYRSVFSVYFMRGHKYEVCEVNMVGKDVAEIVLKPKGIPLSFHAGQFAFVSFDSDVVDNEPHPYSFSNANNGPYVRFSVKSLGDDTAHLRHLKPGTKAFIEGPYGTFSYLKVKNKKQVWIAGGIGITPFLSMARSFTEHTKKHYEIRFFYGTNSLDEAVFLQEFIDITRHLPKNFNTSIVSKDMTGFVSVDLLKKSLDNLMEYDYMICGPPGMMKVLTTQLRQAGVPDEQIHTEAFAM